MKNYLVCDGKKIQEQSYIWNSIGGLLNAGQSALLLMVISRTNSAYDAGIYSIGYAIACLGLTVGCFGIRNYQSTDVSDKYSFSTYFSTRIVTDICMFILVLYYVFKGVFFLDYSYSKCVVVLLLGLLKMVDSVEDVFHGMYQRHGRLDIAGRCATTRYGVMIASFTLALCLTHNLVIAAFISLLCSLGYFLFTIFLTFHVFNQTITIKIFDKNILYLLRENVSLFIGGFLALYIANAPKYAIDEFRSEVEQACFSYIFMPVYVVNVLNSFIYQPMLSKMALLYSENKRKEFINMFFRQILFIFSLIIVILIGSYLLGIPVLSFLFNIELNEYKMAFMVLMIGSCFLAMEGYIAAIITVMRKQAWLVVGYVVTAIVIISMARKVVLISGVLGAAILYSSGICIQMLVFIILFFIFWNVKGENNV